MAATTDGEDGRDDGGGRADVRSRMRLDERVVVEGIAPSRSQAQRMIMSGVVFVDGQRSDKAGTTVRSTQSVTAAETPRFVSRGGDKLDNGIDDLGDVLDERGLVIGGAAAIDVGASTGGFTDCLLQRGALSVIAVDVGWGQLHPRLREDPRVQVLERTNARHLEPSMLQHVPDLLTCDASFIPLGTVLPAVIECMAPGFWGLVLVKPQFEAGRERMGRHGRKGVLRDEAVRATVLAETHAALEALGMDVLGSAEARPRGPKGNVEYVTLVRDARRVVTATSQ